MTDPLNYPVLIFVVTFLVLWLAAWMGGQANQRRKALTDDALRDDYGVVQAATLTMLGLLIGFSFSMATGRYDLRKSYEEAEANAIGTEYVRADLLLPAEEIPHVKALLREYTAERLRFYTAKSWMISTRYGRIRRRFRTSCGSRSRRRRVRSLRCYGALPFRG